MGVNSLPKAVTRQRCDCDLNPGPSAPESGTLTTRLPSHPIGYIQNILTYGYPAKPKNCRFFVNINKADLILTSPYVFVIIIITIKAAAAAAAAVAALSAETRLCP